MLDENLLKSSNVITILRKCMFKHQNIQIFYLKLSKDKYFFLIFKVVGRGSETQLVLTISIFDLELEALPW